jgi:ectoine hydroxylase-related dioxygenase (phytanoyl-CoA dioxygenase family)
LAFDTWFLTVARMPEILDMVEQVLGEDIALWNSSFFAKPARVGTKTPWHQDGEYWPIRPLATCTVWIAIDASTPENGCLRVIPGSHRARKLAPHRQNDAEGLALNLELDAGEFDESEAVDIVLEPGQVSNPGERACWICPSAPSTSCMASIEAARMTFECAIDESAAEVVS